MSTRFSGALWALALLWPVAGQAAIVERLAIEDLALRASRIVEATVIDTESRWVDRLIVTEALVRVDRCYKGACEETAVVRVLGGEVDGIGMRVEGVAALPVGERVLLFLEPAGVEGDHLRVAGLAQGCFHLRQAGDDLVALRSLHGLSLLGAGETAPALPLRAVIAALERALDR